MEPGLNDIVPVAHLDQYRSPDFVNFGPGDIDAPLCSVYARWQGAAVRSRPDDRRAPYIDTPSPVGLTLHSCIQPGEILRHLPDERRPERYVERTSSGWSHAFLTAKHHRLRPDPQAEVIEYIDTWIFSSQKCFALPPA